MGDDADNAESKVEDGAEEVGSFFKKIKDKIQEYLDKIKEKYDDLTSGLPECPKWVKYVIVALLLAALGYYIYKTVNL